MLERLAVAAFILAAAPVHAIEQSVEGYWLTENRKAIVETRVCGANLCGHMVWLADPVDENGAAKLGADGKPLCGTQLIGGLAAAKTGRWTDGWIIDPRSGDRYSVAIAQKSEGEIEVRGYLGFRFLGSSQVWTRVPDDRGGC